MPCRGPRAEEGGERNSGGGCAGGKGRDGAGGGGVGGYAASDHVDAQPRGLRGMVKNEEESDVLRYCSAKWSSCEWKSICSEGKRESLPV